MGAYLTRLLKDSSGASAIEMGLIASLIVLAMLGALQGFGREVTGTWNIVQQESAKAIEKSQN